MAGGRPQSGELSEYSDGELRWECESAARPWDQDERSRCADPVGDQLDDDDMPVEVDAWWDAFEASLRPYKMERRAAWLEGRVPYGKTTDWRICGTLGCTNVRVC